MMLKLPASAGMGVDATRDSSRWKRARTGSASTTPRAARGAGHRPRRSRVIHSATSRPIASGESCRSESISTTASPRGVGQTGLDGGLMAEVARQMDHADVRDAASADESRISRGGVGRAVVDEDDFLPRAAVGHRVR